VGGRGTDLVVRNLSLGRRGRSASSDGPLRAPEICFGRYRVEE